MAVIINNETTITFSLNGVDHQKNYVPVVSGENVIIVSAYDSDLVLLKSTPFGDFTINGIKYASSQEVSNILTPLLYSKQVVSSAGATRTDSTTIQLYDAVEGVIHVNTDNSPMTATDYVIDLSNAVEGGGAVIKANVSSNLNFTVQGGSAPIIYPDNDAIGSLGTYRIILWYVAGEILVFIPGAGTGGTDTTNPQVTSAEVGAINDTTLRVVFNENIDQGSVPANGDNVVTNAGNSNPVTNVTLGVNYMDLTLTNAVSGGEAVVWSYTKGTNPIRDNAFNELDNVSSYSVTNNVNVGYILDGLPTPEFAFSFQKLATASGNGIIVTKDDITFETVILEASGSIETTSSLVSGGTLAAWAGTDAVYMSEVINQGSGANMGQTTHARRPRIMNNGVLDLTNAMAAMDFLGTDDRLMEIPRMFDSDTWSMHVVLELTDITGNQSILTQTPGSAVDDRMEPIQCFGGELDRRAFINIGGTSHVLSYSTDWTTGQKFIAFYANGGTYRWQENAGAFETLLTGAASYTPLDRETVLGNQKSSPTFNNAFKGKFQELILWRSVRTDTQKNTVKANQEARY